VFISNIFEHDWLCFKDGKEAIMRGDWLPQKKSLRLFIYLTFFALVGILFFAIVQNLFEFLASKKVEGTYLAHLYGDLGVYTYFISRWVCPAVMLFGLISSGIVYIYPFLHKHRTSVLH
jgi:hypothetical protein